MGHCVDYLTFDLATSKSEITSSCNRRAVMDGDYHSSLNNSIRFIDKVYDSREEAENAIDKMDNGWYDQIAVKYRHGQAKGKSVDALKERHKAAFIKWQKADREYHFANAKAALITCQSCGGKIPNKYMRNKNYCPICNADMRPETVRSRIAKLKANYNALGEKLAEAERQASKKSNDIKWLVKIEYHI